MIISSDRSLEVLLLLTSLSTILPQGVRKDVVCDTIGLYEDGFGGVCRGGDGFICRSRGVAGNMGNGCKLQQNSPSPTVIN